MGVVGQVWWLDLLLVNLLGLLLGSLFATLRARKVHQVHLDAVHRNCWAEQDRWLEEHESRIATAEQERLDAKNRAQSAELERDHLRAELELGMERVRREMDGARVGYCKAEQALCQQLLAMDRQVVAERTAHRREVQALRMQCDELGELLAAERQTLRVDADQHRQVCTARDNLRHEVGKLLDLLEQSDTAQAALQHRANALEQQMALGQRQLEDARQALERERIRMPTMRPVAQAALTTIATAALAANAHPPIQPGACGLRPFERQPDSPPPDNLLRVAGIGPSTQTWLNRCGVWYLWQIAGWKVEELQWVAGHLPRFGRRVYRENWVGQAKALLDEQRRERRVYPARLPPGVQDRRVNARQVEALAAA
jgi:predicted flap endonuclease-1-like 5' DNA nuclease